MSQTLVHIDRRDDDHFRPVWLMIAATALDALILEQTAEAVIYADHKGVIERWNAAAAAMFGFTAAEALRSYD